MERSSSLSSLSPYRDFLPLRVSLGKSFLKRTKWLVMFPPAMTSVTATIIITSPMLSLTVKLSPKTVIPKMMAVTGSNAPRMAVG